jgi:glycosyltransferase involved in cell wall biosynthesis
MVDAATHFKSMIFHVIGSDGKDLDAPENIIFHGWISQEEVVALMKKTAIFVRITKHDGNSMSVVEALGNGCEVIWSYPNEKTYLATNSDELISTLENLKIQIEQKGLIPNRSNFEYVSENFKKEIIIGNYIKEINKFIDEN